VQKNEEPPWRPFKFRFPVWSGGAARSSANPTDLSRQGRNDQAASGQGSAAD